MHHAYTCAAYFFAIFMLILVAWSVLTFGQAGQRSACKHHDDDNKAHGHHTHVSCGVLVTQGVLYSVGAAVALAALVACAMRASKHAEHHGMSHSPDGKTVA